MRGKLRRWRHWQSAERQAASVAGWLDDSEKLVELGHPYELGQQLS
jgi:hypothetical protein